MRRCSDETHDAVEVTRGRVVTAKVRDSVQGGILPGVTITWSLEPTMQTSGLFSKEIEDRSGKESRR